MSIIVCNCQHCDEQQFQTLSCVHYTIFSVVKLDLFIRALLLDRILALEKTTRTPRVHLVTFIHKISQFNIFSYFILHVCTCTRWYSNYLNISLCICFFSSQGPKHTHRVPHSARTRWQACTRWYQPWGHEGSYGTGCHEGCYSTWCHERCSTTWCHEGRPRWSPFCTWCHARF